MKSILIFLNAVFYDLSTFCHQKESNQTLHCIRVKLLNIFVVFLFDTALFRRSLRTRLTAGCTYDENQVVARCLPHYSWKEALFVF